jgi:hypothetical protein
LIALAAESSRQIRLSWAEVKSTVAVMTPPEEARRDRSGVYRWTLMTGVTGSRWSMAN